MWASRNGNSHRKYKHSSLFRRIFQVFNIIFLSNDRDNNIVLIVPEDYINCFYITLFVTDDGQSIIRKSLIRHDELTN